MNHVKVTFFLFCFGGLSSCAPDQVALVKEVLFPGVLQTHFFVLAAEQRE